MATIRKITSEERANRWIYIDGNYHADLGPVLSKKFLKRWEKDGIKIKHTISKDGTVEEWSYT